MKDQTLSALLSDLGALSRDEIAGVLLALAARVLNEQAPAPAVVSDRALTVPEAAERLGFTVQYTRGLVQRHELPAVREGKYVRVSESALQRWIRAKESEGGGVPAPIRPSRYSLVGGTARRRSGHA